MSGMPFSVISGLKFFHLMLRIYVSWVLGKKAYYFVAAKLIQKTCLQGVTHNIYFQRLSSLKELFKREEMVSATLSYFMFIDQIG
jgi:hypothetical protein